MADKLISQLGATAAVLTTDLLVKEPNAGPPAEKATVAQLVTLLDTIYLRLTGGQLTGSLTFSADNTHDIGASGATRPRTGYFGTSLVTALVASPAATALSFASAGTTRANFSTAGHLLFNTDNTNDIGAPGATRPRSGYFSGSLQAGVTGTFGGDLYCGETNVAGVLGSWTRGYIGFMADGVWRITNNAATDFGRLQFGGTTSAFPSIKRSTTILQGRLADDSAYCDIEGRILRTATAFTVATLPAAGTAGRMAYVTDATAPTYNGALVGGGAVVVPVFDNGAAWVSV